MLADKRHCRTLEVHKTHMARRRYPLNALRAFEAAGRHGRMSQAADELHVTHSAVSRQVQQLEDFLGVALFEGPKNALRLTEAGRTLLSGLSGAFDQIDLSVRMVADSEDGPLDVSCLGTFSMRWLIPRLYRFEELHPRIEVRLTASDRPVDFGRDGFDVAIRVGEGSWSGEAEVIRLFAEQIGPVLAPALWKRFGQRLAKVPVLHTKTRPRAWSDWLLRSGRALDVAAGREYEHFYFMLEAATAGLGVCIAPWPLVSDDIRAGRLVAPYGFLDSGQNYLALRRTRRHRKSSLFCDWLRAEAQRFENESEHSPVN
jgi:LysR family transcriptional regulator, glycine cleavage system transcriptional activator